MTCAQVLVDIFPQQQRVHIHSCVCFRNFLSVPLQFQLSEQFATTPAGSDRDVNGDGEGDDGSGVKDGSDSASRQQRQSQRDGHVWMVKPGETWEMPTDFLRDDLLRLDLRFGLAIPGAADEWKRVRTHVALLRVCVPMQWLWHHCYHRCSPFCW